MYTCIHTCTCRPIHIWYTPGFHAVRLLYFYWHEFIFYHYIWSVVDLRCTYRAHSHAAHELVHISYFFILNPVCWVRVSVYVWVSVCGLSQKTCDVYKIYVYNICLQASRMRMCRTSKYPIYAYHKWFTAQSKSWCVNGTDISGQSYDDKRKNRWPTAYCSHMSLSGLLMYRLPGETACVLAHHRYELQRLRKKSFATARC